ncbi:K+-sensing histidine kinase KdpD [Streptosporangium lutulentum]|uniref:K+-sensing histidine kinase KdpD n=1 Tax=Streptosporangium lutulentum TaxID=1461250 RepID=A0ABT9QFJ3_9ACTN|nr:K+-sensing histidine kinase KdpD [Streptosporangium lutulentum]
MSQIQIRKRRGLLKAVSLDLRTPSGRPMPY